MHHLILVKKHKTKQKIPRKYKQITATTTANGHWYLLPISALRAITTLLYPYFYCHCQSTKVGRTL